MADDIQGPDDAYLRGYSDEQQEQIRSDWHAAEGKLGEIIRAWFDKCCQSLGILNAGALIAILGLGSSLMGKDRPIDVSPLLPAAYGFSIGLVLVAVAVFLTMALLERMSMRQDNISRRMHDNKLMVGAAWKELTDSTSLIDTIFRVVQTFLIVSSFACFFYGLFGALNAVQVIHATSAKAAATATTLPKSP